VGFCGGKREQQNLLELEQFLSSPRVSVCNLGEASAIHYAAIYRSLKQKGRPIPLNDIWIAATTMEHGAVLVSADQHFQQVDGLLLNMAY
jgi:tRNA(fMet)-specific endonuclease VapC